MYYYIRSFQCTVAYNGRVCTLHLLGIEFFFQMLRRITVDSTILQQSFHSVKIIKIIKIKLVKKQICYTNQNGHIRRYARGGLANISLTRTARNSLDFCIQLSFRFSHSASENLHSRIARRNLEIALGPIYTHRTARTRAPR